MQITEEQKRILDSFTCERLSSNPDNLRGVENFCNLRNGSLEHTLKDTAYAEDEANHIAYYLIKDADGNILFYFSLKCGMLYDSLDQGEQLRKLNGLFRFLVELENDSSSTVEDRQTINSILESIRTRKGLVKEDLAKISRTKKNQLLEELVGAVIFWHFVVPKICEAKKLIGCQYLFLFAADLTPDELLINYYETFLGFRSSNERGTAIPFYDYACKFMYQEINGIEERRERFYRDFNPDEESV